MRKRSEGPRDPLRVAADHARERLDADVEAQIAPGTRERIHEAWLERYDFEAPRDAADVIDGVARALQRGVVHVGHPGYFGPYHPSVHPAGVAASTLAAAFNPQLAVRSHARAAAAIEDHTLAFFLRALGWDPTSAGAHFTNGGSEANTEALLVALGARFPETREGGLTALDGPPLVYASAEAHRGLEKSVRVLGLGSRALRRVPVDAHLRMDVTALATMVAEDRARGAQPFAVVGTAGTTSSGAIDPLDEVATFASRTGLRFHVDAAWAGALLVSPSHRSWLVGIERADSVTFDAHKWLQAPLVAGMLFVRERALLHQTFGVEGPYMPRRRAVDPDLFETSLSWSRRALGLPLFAIMASVGRAGLTELVERAIALGDELRAALTAAGFTILRPSPLPVVCFTHAALKAGSLDVHEVARRVARSGASWLSPTTLSTGEEVLRASVSGHRTRSSDVARLVEVLVRAVRD